MKITETRVYPIKGQKGSNLKAFAQITFEDEFVVTGLRVVNGKKGMFVTMPATKGSDEEYHDTCFPLTAELREKITKKVLKAYNEGKDKKAKADDDEEDED